MLAGFTEPMTGVAVKETMAAAANICVTDSGVTGSYIQDADDAYSASQLQEELLVARGEGLPAASLNHNLPQDLQH